MNFFALLGRNARLIVAAFLLVTAAAIGASFLMTPFWKAEVVMTPVNARSSTFLGGLQGSLGGLGLASSLSSLADSGAPNDSLVILQSRQIFDRYAKQENLLPVLFSDIWDADTNSWTVAPDRIPTLRRAYSVFDKSIRQVEEDRRSGAITLTITWKNREQAVKWAHDLVQMVNQETKDRALSEARRNMAYLSEQMKQTTDVAALSSLTQAYQRQVEAAMFAQGNTEYSLHVVDPPTVPDVKERVRPNRPLIASAGAVLGLMLGLLGAMLMEWKRRNYPRALRFLDRLFPA